jgi:hypothetical protein
MYYRGPFPRVSYSGILRRALTIEFPLRIMKVLG